MGTALLTAAVGVLAFLGLFNLVLTLGLARRLRHELGTPAAGGATQGGPSFPTVGLRVGTFSELLPDGATVTDADVSTGETLVAYFSAGCPACAKVKRRLLSHGSALPLTVFVVGSAADPEVVELAEGLAPIAGTVAIVDHDGSAAAALSVEAYPTLVRLEEGVVRASGYKLDAVLPDTVAVG